MDASTPTQYETQPHPLTVHTLNDLVLLARYNGADCTGLSTLPYVIGSCGWRIDIEPGNKSATYIKYSLNRLLGIALDDKERPYRVLDQPISDLLITAPDKESHGDPVGAPQDFTSLFPYPVIMRDNTISWEATQAIYNTFRGELLPTVSDLLLASRRPLPEPLSPKMDEHAVVVDEWIIQFLQEHITDKRRRNATRGGEFIDKRGLPYPLQIYCDKAEWYPEQLSSKTLATRFMQLTGFQLGDCTQHVIKKLASCHETVKDGYTSNARRYESEAEWQASKQ